jgi:hypothetical protein
MKQTIKRVKKLYICASIPIYKRRIHIWPRLYGSACINQLYLSYYLSIQSAGQRHQKQECRLKGNKVNNLFTLLLRNCLLLRIPINSAWARTPTTLMGIFCVIRERSGDRCSLSEHLTR